MFGLSTTEIFIFILLIIIGGEKAIKLLSLIPGFAPLAQAIEKLTKNGKNGNGKKTEYSEILQKHEERLDVANSEMSDVKISLAKIEVNIENIKESQERQEKAITNIYHKLDNA